MSEVNGMVRMYATGGGGINLASSWAGNVAPEPGVAEVLPAYIDTSRTNVIEGIDESNSYILPDLDGSGGLRRENHEPIAREIPRILIKFPPTDFNIVVFTGAGGSGSVAGPMLIAELLERNQNVIGVVIGSEESAIRSRNTFNTLKSLDNLAHSKGKPITIFYARNSRDVKRSEIDRQAKHVLVAINYLASRQNRELDTKDIAHFINYHKVTSVTPQLSLLNVYTAIEDVEQYARNAFSMASLLKELDDPQPDLHPAYSCTGYYRPGVKNPNNLFFTIETEGLSPILNHLQKLAKSVDEHDRARQDGPRFVGENDQVSSTGLIL